MFHYSIQTAIQAVFLGHGEVRSQQRIHGRAQIPLAMHAKLAAWIQQPVHHQKLQHFFPCHFLPRSGQTRIPKLIEPQLVPQLAP
jgi:hypothetical protein